MPRHVTICRYQSRLFRLHLPEWQDPAGQRRIVRIVYNQFVNVARRVQPQQHVTGQGWRTSRSKILDNALIGFCKLDLVGLPAKAEDGAVNQISFDVLGLPPAKDGANSIFGAGSRLWAAGPTASGGSVAGV